MTELRRNICRSGRYADINHILSTTILGAILLHFEMDMVCFWNITALEVPNTSMAQVVIPYSRILQYNFPMKDLISTASYPLR